jgi:hypothetical protein
MIIERILLETELNLFYIGIKNCLILEGIKPTKKHLESIYDYVRLNNKFSLNNPQKTFYELLNEKDDLLFFEVNSFDGVYDSYGIFGKINFIKIKLLEIEIYVKKHKLYLSHIGKNF